MKVYDIIQYEGPNDVLVHKHEAEDFNTMSQLIVHESQEAVFFRNGQALDLFGPGRYTLQTQNIPILGKLVGLPSGGKTPFHCEVYFINRTVLMNMVWGTDSPIPLRDPEFDIDVMIRANGQMALSVRDSRRLLVQLVGTAHSLDLADITRYFKGAVMMEVKDAIAKTMIHGNIGIRTVSSHLVELSAACKEALDCTFDEYGLELKLFNIASVTAPRDDPGYQSIQRSIAKAVSRRIEGYTWQQEQAYGVAKTAAANEGMVGTVANAGMGMGIAPGVGLPLGMGVGSALSGVLSPIGGMAVPAVRCPRCGAALAEDSMFCHKCGCRLREATQCHFCGAVLPPESVFCPNCGKKQETTVVCASCGAKMPADGKFCARCGAKREEAPQ